MPRLKDQVCDLRDGFPIYAGLSCHRQIAREVFTGPREASKIRSSVKKKGDSRFIRHPPSEARYLEDYFDFFSVISPFFSVPLSDFAALTELTIIFPSFSV